MTTIVFNIALPIEIIFMAYCIITKSNQSKVKSFIRIGAFAVFIIFTLFSVIEWSFRWYGLALLLLIWAALGVRKLLRKQKVEKEYKLGRIIGKTIFELILIVIVMVPAIVFPQYKNPEATGAYKVATAVYTYTDKSRLEAFTNNGENRKVTVEFWYPQEGKDTYPLVVFTHGLYGIAASNSSTFNDLASNGYVVCSISHPYISLYTKSAEGKVTVVSNGYMKDASILNSGIDDEKIIYDTFEKLLQTRSADTNFVLDTILSNAGQGTDAVYQLIDTSKIGMFGHSMGGTTVAALGRERSDIGAVVNLDAPLFGDLSGFQNGGTVLIDSPYPRPLLNIYSDDLWGHMDPDPIYAGNVRLLSNTPEGVYNVHFNGAKHMNFTDLALASPMIANALQGGKAEINAYDCIETMNGLILDFFNYYLKGVGSFNPSSTY